MGNIHLIYAPYDSGHPNARMGNGPHKLQQEGLPEKLRKQRHVVHSTTLQILPGKFRTEVGAAYDLMSLAKDSAQASHQQGAFPIVISGNSNISIGMIAALQQHTGSAVSVIWFDAHGDFNTPETTLSGFFDGMTLGVLTGRCWKAITARCFPGFQHPKAESIVHAGGRDFDPGEKSALQESGIHLVDTASIMADPAAAFREATAVLRAHAVVTHLHVDFDALDPVEAPANQYTAPHGISVARMKDSIHSLCADLQVKSASFSAYDPGADPQNKTAAAAIEIISALCKSISPEKVKQSH